MDILMHFTTFSHHSNTGLVIQTHSTWSCPWELRDAPATEFPGGRASPRATPWGGPAATLASAMAAVSLGSKAAARKCFPPYLTTRMSLTLSRPPAKSSKETSSTPDFVAGFKILGGGMVKRMSMSRLDLELTSEFKSQPLSSRNPVA